MVVPGSIPRMTLSLFLRESGGESCTSFCYIYQYNMSSKHINKLGLGLKVAIVFLAAGYIAWRLFGKNNSNFSFEEFINSIQAHSFLFASVLILMPVNWFIEALKWKAAAGQSGFISTGDAVRGVLAGVTIGTATPNRVGEFAGRIFMVKNGDRVQLLLLSFIPSFAQVTITILAGCLGFIFHPGMESLRTIEIIALVSGTILFLVMPFLLLRFLPAKWKEKTNVLKTFPPKLFTRILFLSLVRYSIYVFQFLLLLIVAGSNVDWKIALICITVSYFIVTIIPTFSVTEILVRGGVFGFVFSDGGVAFGLAFTAAVTLWFINVAIPSLIGSIFVFRLKFSQKEE